MMQDSDQEEEEEDATDPHGIIQREEPRRISLREFDAHGLSAHELADRAKEHLQAPRDPSTIRAIYQQARSVAARVRNAADPDGQHAVHHDSFAGMVKNMMQAVHDVNMDKQIVSIITKAKESETPSLKKGILGVRILSAHNLPNTWSDLPNPYVLISLASSTYRTTTHQSCPDPAWGRKFDKRQFSFVTRTEESHRHLILDVVSDGIGVETDIVLGSCQLDVHALPWDQWQQFTMPLLCEDGELAESAASDHPAQLVFELRLARPANDYVMAEVQVLAQPSLDLKSHKLKKKAVGAKKKAKAKKKSDDSPRPLSVPELFAEVEETSASAGAYRDNHADESKKVDSMDHAAALAHWKAIRSSLDDGIMINTSRSSEQSPHKASRGGEQSPQAVSSLDLRDGIEVLNAGSSGSDARTKKRVIPTLGVAPNLRTSRSRIARYATKHGLGNMPCSPEDSAGAGYSSYRSDISGAASPLRKASKASKSPGATISTISLEDAMPIAASTQDSTAAEAVGKSIPAPEVLNDSQDLGPTASRSLVAASVNARFGHCMELASKFESIGAKKESLELMMIKRGCSNDMLDEARRHISSIENLCKALSRRVDQVEEVRQHRRQAMDVAQLILQRISSAENTDDSAQSPAIEQPQPSTDGAAVDSALQKYASDIAPHRGKTAAAKMSSSSERLQGETLQERTAALNSQDLHKASSTSASSTIGSKWRIAGKKAALLSSFQTGSVNADVHDLAELVEKEIVESCSEDEASVATQLLELLGSNDYSLIQDALQRSQDAALQEGRPSIGGLMAALDWRKDCLLSRPDEEPDSTLQKKAWRRGFDRAAASHRAKNINQAVTTKPPKTGKTPRLRRLANKVKLGLALVNSTATPKTEVLGGQSKKSAADQAAAQTLAEGLELLPDVYHQLTVSKTDEDGVVDHLAADMAELRSEQHALASLLREQKIGSVVASQLVPERLIETVREVMRNRDTSQLHQLVQQLLAVLKQADFFEISSGLQQTKKKQGSAAAADRSPNEFTEENSNEDLLRHKKSLTELREEGERWNCYSWELTALLQHEGWPREMATSLRKLGLTRRRHFQGKRPPCLHRRLYPGPVQQVNFDPNASLSEPSFVSQTSLMSQPSVSSTASPRPRKTPVESLQGSVHMLLASPSAALLSRSSLPPLPSDPAPPADVVHLHGSSGWIVPRSGASGAVVLGERHPRPNASVNAQIPPMSHLDVQAEPKSARVLEEEVLRNIAASAARHIAALKLPAPKCLAELRADCLGADFADDLFSRRSSISAEAPHSPKTDVELKKLFQKEFGAEAPSDVNAMCSVLARSSAPVRRR